jgi:hypothetical protein
MNSKKGKLWGFGVWLLYISFVVFVLGCIAFVAFRRYDLVEPDYYEKGLEYQKQLGKIQPTAADSPVISYDEITHILTLSFSKEGAASIDSGSILFFKPSDAQQDFRVKMNLDNIKRQQIDDKRLGKGFWRLKIDWFSEGKNYYYEDVLLVG